MPKYRVTKSVQSVFTSDVEAASAEQAVVLAGEQVGTLEGQSVLYSVVETHAVVPPPPVLRPLPAGWGTYLRRLSGVDTAQIRQTVEDCLRERANWAALMVEANDGYQNAEAVLKAYAVALRDAGIEVAVWSFPGDTRAATVAESQAASELLVRSAELCEARYVMLDIELPYKNRSQQLKALVDEALRLTELQHRSVGVVSYPVPSYHPTLDWDALKPAHWGSPMFYKSAADEALVARGMTEWMQIQAELLPSLDAFSGSGIEGAKRFAGDIARVCGTPPDARVRGALAWSEQQISDAKRDVMAQTGASYGWPQSASTQG